MDMEARIEAIGNRTDLGKFVGELADSLRNGAQWENRDLLSFLEAMAAWIDDMDGYFENRGMACPKEPSWQTLAQIIAASTMYE